jgi:hypothetical protein
VNAADLLELRREAEAAFANYPGFLGVGIGFRVRGGQIVDEVTLRVYVSRKKPQPELRPDELIPSSFKNVPTDVLEPHLMAPEATSCEDQQQHGTLVGGITISTLKPDSHGLLGLGTIGFFATYAGEDPPYNVVLVTNNHVVTDALGGVGDDMYQPAWKLQGGSLVPLFDQGDKVGTVLKLPPKQDDANGVYVDAASVKLAISVSSWCHTNCGVSFGNGSEILGLSVNSSNRIASVRDTSANPFVTGETVFKVGRATGRTVGRLTGNLIITEDPVTHQLGHNLIEVEAVSMQTPDNCGGVLRFSNEGDSGAALIDAQGRLIGLHSGGNVNNAKLSHACQIRPVLDALGVVPITASNPVHGNPAAKGMRGDAVAVIEGRDESAVLRGRFMGCEAGRRIAAIVEQHRHEVVRLVNSNRRVTVAWRRGQGPAWLNRAMVNARDPEVPIPRAIEGVTRVAFLVELERTLAENGSVELREAMDEHRDEVLGYATGFDSLHEIVDELAGRLAV